MNLHDAVRAYMGKGLAPVPIVPGTKRPPMKGWQGLRLGEGDISSYFVDPCGVGILTGDPSDGRCDVDLDCDEAVALAPEILPQTAVWSGHDKRPRSHAWYCCTPVPQSTSFTAPDRKKLVELRANGMQTLVYPSRHPDGGQYRWWGNGQPADVEPGLLETSVRRLAAAALLARAWPHESGSRHDIANALAGYLARAGWSEAEVERFVEAVARAAGDEEAAARGAAARSTARKVQADQPVTGAPTLAALVGQAIVDKVADWLDLRRSSVSIITRVDAPAAVRRVWPRPLAPSALIGPAGDLVRLIAPHTESDPVSLLVQSLVSFGSAVGRGPHFRVEADRHYTNLFTCQVGASSKGRKGTGWGHIRRVMQTLDTEWAERCQQSGLSSGEGLIWSVRNPIVQRQLIRQKGKVVDHQEVEVDGGVGDKRLLVFEPEFASTLRVMTRDGSTLSATVRQAWDTGDLQTLTKASPAKARGAHISIVGHITADELRRYIDRTELGNGFANRIIWVCVRRWQVLPEGGRIDQVDFAPLIQRLAGALAFARSLGDTEIGFDDEARSLWREVYPALSEGRPGLLGAVTSRGEAQTIRVALVYALLDSQRSIGRAHLEAGLEVWRYALDSVEFIFGNALGDPTADAILTALRPAGAAGMTRTDISGLFGRNKSAAEISRALEALAEQSLAKCEITESGGRPTEHWFAIWRDERNERNEKSSTEPSQESETDGFVRLFRTADVSMNGDAIPQEPLMGKVVTLSSAPKLGEWDVVSRGEGAS